MSSFNQLVGTRIQQKLDELNWTQTDLAEKLATSRQMVNKIVHGRKKITIEELKSIAEILNVELQELTEKPMEEEKTDPIIAFMGEVNSKEAKEGLEHAKEIMDLIIFHRDLKDSHQDLFV
ncbi:helix-turn-helix transcriptional regulator [Natroniella sulfidigena]|uniref:helix-turn-helix domain-containing protein n=1 Tax=Natroniella sulfidigena TaxID=723921 RepID=UPI00200B9DBB|nr:helix-turn-helix transcriptional regulator [Natroniella sulfidigena]MCK8816284.1 helix-turn-helix transcriptional regulator [Natroniella sulfidigena]